jgi:23S rRNA (cytosine1962-C5)-methyltransferase
MADVSTIHLLKDRDRSLKRRHPWIYSGAIARIEGDPAPGEVVRVVDHKGEFLAWAYHNKRSQIHARVLDWDETASIDEAWWLSRVKEAVERRRDLPGLKGSNVCRLIHAEADELPGLVVDRYGDYLVVQVLTAGVERVKNTIVAALVDAVSPKGIFERSDQETRKIEGLDATAGLLAGEAPPERLEVSEGGYRFAVDIQTGQKTGFYIDQRDNRRYVAEYASGRDVLDLYSYSGGFSVYALGAGASHSTLVDSSFAALELAERNLAANGIDDSRVEIIHGNASEVARSFRDGDRRFDMVIADPPKFAQARAHLEKAERAYKDVNLLGMKLLKPGGLLATFSCSGAVDIEHFSKIITWASVDADRQVQILQRLSQSADHPVMPSFPESEYLKGLICRVM